MPRCDDRQASRFARPVTGRSFVGNGRHRCCALALTTFSALRNLAGAGGRVGGGDLGGGGWHSACNTRQHRGFEVVAIERGNGGDALKKNAERTLYRRSATGTVAKARKESGGAQVVLATAPGATRARPALGGFATGLHRDCAPCNDEPIELSALSWYSKRAW